MAEPKEGTYTYTNPFTNAVYEGLTKEEYDNLKKGEIGRVYTNDNTEKQFQYVDPSTGEIRIGKIGGGSYKYDDWFHTSRNTDVIAAIMYYMQTDQYSRSDEGLLAYIKGTTGNPVAPNEIKGIKKDVETFIAQEGLNPNDFGNSPYYKNPTGGGLMDYRTIITNRETELNKPETDTGTESDDSTDDTYTGMTPNDVAYNSYWNSLYSLSDGSLGKGILDKYAEIEQRAAESNMQLAEAQYQQSALQQAEVVKSITDQVRAERMARLRSGMNEAQIANQDMQIMLNNMNNMNTQMNTMNQNRLAAQQQANLAQDTAYQQYLDTANAMSQSAAAMYASDSGNLDQMAKLYSQATGVPYNQAIMIVSGQQANNTGGK